MNRDETVAALQAAERLHDDHAVEQALEEMAVAITRDLSEAVPVVLCVLIGGLIPTGRLLPKLDFPLEVDYVHATRYRGATRGGELVWIARPRSDLRGREVLIVDDILDEGHTLRGIIEDCLERGAARVRVAALVEKRHDRRHPEVVADYVGLVVDDRYVFGAGMDYHDMLRNAPGIYAVVEQEAGQ
ncbi:hypoxanthine phosphoribosyltransferase [Natronocella acetinitrilica]|uniref:Hypoxanthine phosphoribosyltransferase n=1 Tax=Natronocella acetinitrilica TaxID=414046 RepID=A0AAE3KHE3_9GAMM|nr:hypoxanthine-guanine phosphoribosyltransferase [Natronocella acetinitrilica]MCP1676267.1 hypoxanthine phosphoribosyltransferase [Natronocella acetinitrilica]